MDNKYRFFLIFSTLFVLLLACKSASDDPKEEIPVLNVSAPEKGFIYLDGSYTGYMTPHELSVGKGNHVIGVATDISRKYLRKELEVTGNTEVKLADTDQPQPKIWKALWIGVSEVTGYTATGLCSSRFSKEELDAGYDFFQWSIKNQFEKFSYGILKWEVERKDIPAPLMLTKASNTWFTLEPSTITKALPEIVPGKYDAVFVFWREKDGTCSFQSSYFGLAWTDPMNEPTKTGYITLKFDAGTDINSKIAYYKSTDPGVWVHEWLHTVGENYFQKKGFSLPTNEGNLVVHAAEKYGYTFPWMDWYEDFISGRVKEPANSSGYVGIGPEALLKCSLRESANRDCTE